MEQQESASRRLRVFELEAQGRNVFVAAGERPEVRRLFGGQVAAQAFVAAARSVEPELGQHIHSLHGYFLRPGRGGVPIHYTVHSLKDGRNFSARDVVASQGEEVIFSLHASFTRPEPGISHLEVAMPDAPPPETLTAQPGPLRFLPEQARRWLEGPVAMRSCDPEIWDAEGKPLPSRRRVWIRPSLKLPDDPIVHTAALIWVSDRSLLQTGARPHGGRQRRSASLDHCIWFHHPVRFDDWWLYVMESPVAHAARALIQGAMYRRDGTRVLSVAQEGLLRS